MPRDANGNTNPLPGTIVATGDTILPSQHNPMVNDVYAMMTQSLSRDGQGGMRAALNMNGFPVRNVGLATQPNDAVSLSQFQNGMPLGAVVDFAGVTAPNTWMLCFGQAIEVSAYPDFVAACYVGNALNATAGFGYRTTSQTDPSANRSTSGQFIVLPDYRDRASVGKGDMGGATAGRINSSVMNTSLIGASGGTDRHILTVNEMPSHNHGGSTGAAGAHSHTYDRADPGIGYGGNGSYTGAINTQTTSVAPDHYHAIAPQGGGAPHLNLQPSLVANKIIKVSY